MVSKTINFIIRGIQTLLAVVLIALLGSLFAQSYFNQYSKDGNARDDALMGTGNASEINMAMWCAVFSLCSVFWLVVVVSCLPIREPENPQWWTAYTSTWVLFILVPEGFNVIFYFSDAIALAAALGAHSCANRAYTLQNGITNSATDTARRCREAQAVAVFMFFSLLMWILSAILSIEAVMPWDEWPSVAWLVPWRAGTRDTDARNPETHDGEPPLAVFSEPWRGGGTTNFGSGRDDDLEQPPQAANLGSWRSRSSGNQAKPSGGPAVPANDDGIELDTEDGRGAVRGGGPEVTGAYPTIPR